MRKQAVGLVLVPLITPIDDCSKENEILHRIRNSIFWNAIFFFSAKMSVRHLKKIVHSLAIPPVEAKDQLCKRGHLHIMHLLPVASLLVILMKLVDCG